ncbi:MAG: dTMP kinase [Actinomycetales bacterium]|nr:dTMP kinase [Actinomycetales bacterium]
MSHSGLFIAFEGIDGAGKSTQVAALAATLTAAGHEVICTREPGGTAIGARIRAILLDPQHTAMVARTEALLFAADRAQHAAELIRPALARGAIILGDRYWDSSIAYQGIARGLGAERIADLSRWATEDLPPDLTVLLDLEPRAAGERPRQRDRIDDESVAFHGRVAAALRSLAADEPQRYLVVPADLPVSTIADRVATEVAARTTTGDRLRPG